MGDAVRLTLTNSSGSALRVFFEPWGKDHELATGSSFDLEFLAARPGQPHIEVVSNGMIVWAWPSATLAVRSGGALIEHFPVAVPDVPAGTQVSDFLKAMLGWKGPRRD